MGACVHVKFAYTSNPIDSNESIQVMKTGSTWECLEDGDLRNEQSSLEVFKGGLLKLKAESWRLKAEAAREVFGELPCQSIMPFNAAGWLCINFLVLFFGGYGGRDGKEGERGTVTARLFVFPESCLWFQVLMGNLLIRFTSVPVKVGAKIPVTQQPCPRGNWADNNFKKEWQMLD